MQLIKQSTAALLTVRLVNSTTGAPLTGVTSGSVTATVFKSDGSNSSVTTSGNWTELTAGAGSGSGTYTLAISSSLTNLTGVFITIVSVSGANIFAREDQVFAELTDDIYTRIGAPAGASIAADIATVETHASNADTQSSNTYSRLGAPAGASIAADIATVETHASNADTQSANTYSRLGAPAGASIAADIAQVETHAASADTNASTAATQATTAATQASAAATTSTSINTKLGSPAGASVSADIAAVKTDTQRIKVIQEGKKVISSTGTYANEEVAYDTDGVTILQHSKLYDENGVPTSTDPFSIVPQVSIP